ncbi:SMP-30/gluconolactonase/LRE family protein [uncultured Algibacter sp.]|uniref:SMP-30/gluconolactonase/LRE family protein n=1 Tax=uncultured Algibacter sp. TaxID=298659 RepID=UPI003216D7E6
MIKTYTFFLLSLILVGCISKEKKTATTDNSKATSIKNEVTLAYKTEAKLGEGAIWNYKTNALLWIDIEGKAVHIYNPKTNKNRKIATPSRIGTIVPKNDGDVLVALEDGMYNLNLETETFTLFSDMKSDLADSRLNDGKCDPSGRLWVGSMHLEQLEGKANLYTINGRGEKETKIKNVTISNGIVWTSDKKTMYYIDTPTSQITAYDYDNETGAISNKRIAVSIPTELGFPDGMTIDEENMLWVGMWNGNAVIRFNPETGKVLEKIEVPAHNITSCAFGGDNLDVLYITSATVDMSDDELKEYPLAGSVFKVVPGVKGVKSSFFK